MHYPFREFHIFRILDTFSQEEMRLPLDRFLSSYFRKNRAVGAQDRRVICQAIYDMIRWKGSLDYLATRPLTWQSRYDTYSNVEWKKQIEESSIPPHVRVSFPNELYSLLTQTLGEDKGNEFCHVCNDQAPTTIRINPLKTTREALLKQWESLYDIAPTPHSPLGIVFFKKINFFALPEFKKGLFEMQDEGSQLLADLMEVGPLDQVLDYCSGSGGKTLAFAPKMQGKGQIYLHDIRTNILQEAKKRLKRAGIQNSQILLHDDPKKKRLRKKMDWVLVDAPCTGLGTLRRNPDMKWKFRLESVEELVYKQQDIFEKALKFLKEDGKIVYATCSVLPQENEEQVAFFKNKFSLNVLKTYQTFPKKGEMDGFFGAVLSPSKDTE